MSRKSHKKSKNGCSECKTRHMKCDESRPSCINCQTADFVCSFLNERRLGVSTQRPSSLPGTNTTSPASSHTGGRAEHNDKVYDQPSFTSAINMAHLQLFHHFRTETLRSLGSKTADREASYQMIMRCGLSTPYLMHEMLAIAALHLSVLNPAEGNIRQHEATELQQRALVHFMDSKPEATAANCIPMFLFSSLLGIHLLCDTLRYRDKNLSAFLDRFTQYLNLNRGFRSVTNSSWHLLQQSELAPWLKISEAMTTGIEGSGSECGRLLELVHSTGVGRPSLDAYEEAIKHLQSVFELSQGRPEAVIILAHYAVLLQSHRWLWLIGEGGEFLIRTISRSLGQLWAQWLEWPLRVLDASV